MTDAEQFLADLEAKAKAATPGDREFLIVRDDGDVKEVLGAGDKHILVPDYYPNYAGNGYDQRLDISDADEDFITIANPAAVLRLVSMVRWLAEQIREDDGGSKAWIQAAYHATEPNHD